jgi:site-specific recombinase XerD
MANRAEGTIETHAASVRRFEEYLGNDLADASQEAIRHWVDHLREQAVGASRLGQHYSALKFLYARTLVQPEKVAWITIRRPRHICRPSWASLRSSDFWTGSPPPNTACSSP